MNAIEKSFVKNQEIVDMIKSTQLDNINKAAVMIAKAHEAGKRFLVSGSGHSHCVAEELYGRAGCLGFTVPIITDELTLTAHPTKSTYIERLTGYAHILCELYEINTGDVLLIASNSGRNAYPVELADEARRLGAFVIAITNMRHTKSCTPRNKLGKHLYEVSDVIIDNCGEIGDAALKLEGMSDNICPTSSIANSFICSALTAGVCEQLLLDGKDTETLVSANIDGGFEKNASLFKKYGRMYK